MLCKKYVDTALDSLCSAASFRTVVVLAHLHSHSSTIVLRTFSFNLSRYHVCVCGCRFFRQCSSVIVISTHIFFYILIKPGGRYFVTSGTGDLYIRSVKIDDKLKMFSCQTMNKVTRERKISEPVYLSIKGMRHISYFHSHFYLDKMLVDIHISPQNYFTQKTKLLQEKSI